MPTPHRYAYVTAICAVLAAWVVFCYPWLSGHVTIPYDAKAHFQPQIQFLANALHNGMSPFWTPNVFGGSPQIADPQSMIFSPVFLLAWFDAVPSFRAIDALTFGYLGMAALAIVMFFRDRRWHAAAAVVAALAFAFGASAAWRIQHIKQIESFAFFALALWLLARALERRSLFYGVAAGLATALMIVKPGQIGMLSCYLLAGFCVNHWFSQPSAWKSFKETFKPLLAGAVSCGVLVALPILFTMLFVMASNRPEEPFSEAMTGSLHPASLLTALIPDLYGVSNDSVDYWGPSSANWHPEGALSQNMGQIYLGALPFLAILGIGLWRRILWTKEIRFVSISLLVMIIYALGSYTPVFRAFYEFLPGVNLFRRPADATFMIGGMAAILSGYVIHRVLTGTLPEVSRLTKAAQFVIPLAGFIVAAVIAHTFGHLAAASLSILWSLAVTVAAALVLYLAWRMRGVRQPVLVALLAVFMCGDLCLNNGPNQSTALPPAEYDILHPGTQNETIRFIENKLREPESIARRDRVELVGLGFEWPNAGLVHGFDHVLGYNPLRLAVYADAVGATDTVADYHQRQFPPLFNSYHSTLANLLGLRYIATSVPIDQIDHHIAQSDLVLLARTRDAFIYENRHALPRVQFVQSWQRTDFSALTSRLGWPKFDPAETVLLAENPGRLVPQIMPSEPRIALPSRRDYPGSLFAGTSMHHFNRTAFSSNRKFRNRVHTRLALAAPNESLLSGGSTAAIKMYHNTRVDIEVNTRKPGFVVLNDVWHPWWFATVDGRPATIYRANTVFRAVKVGPGHHTVQFVFRPIKGAIAQLREML